MALSAERGTLGGVFLAGIIAVLLAGSSGPGPADGPRWRLPLACRGVGA